MDAASLNFEKDYPSFPEFARYGIDLSLTHADVVLTLQAIRTAGGFAVYPGPHQSNWGRSYGSETSRHYAIDRLSDAGDVFPARGHALDFWLIAQEFLKVGALGLYLDTRGIDGQPWVMVHFDLREYDRRVMWIRDGDYVYLHNDPKAFWARLSRVAERDMKR